MSESRGAGNVIVVAGGASLLQYNLRDLEKRGIVIGVNDSALFTKCDIAFTMDRLWLEGRQKMIKTLGVPEVWYRFGTPKNFTPPPDWHAFTHEDGYPTKMRTEPGKLNGSNSGTCAINLAFQMARRVFLLGFDMMRGPEGEKHWYPDYPWAPLPVNGTKKGTYDEWAKEFDLIASQFCLADIPIYNVTHCSKIQSFKRLGYDEFKNLTRFK